MDWHIINLKTMLDHYQRMYEFNGVNGGWAESLDVAIACMEREARRRARRRKLMNEYVIPALIAAAFVITVFCEMIRQAG